MQMVQNDQFDEVWIPGFNIMQPSQELMHMRNYMLGDKYVSSVNIYIYIYINLGRTSK